MGSKVADPDASTYDACEEFFRFGDNEHEARADGNVRNAFRRLLR